jgi:8-oxo-dGTP pyrophosphatase MutT (NUDIX family)
MESEKVTITLRPRYDRATTTMSILAMETPCDKSERPFDKSERSFDKSELRSFERFSFPPLSDLFPDVASFRSLGTRSRRTTSHIVLSDEPLHTASLHTESLHTEPTAKVPIYGGILHTVYEGVDYYALVQGRHTGKWSFPKGHLQHGETGPECALREIAEETGMDEVDHERSIGTLFLHYGTYYLYECSGFDPLLPRDQKEIVHAKWMTLEEMRGASLNADVSQFRKQRCRVLAWSLTQSLSLSVA